MKIFVIAGMLAVVALVDYLIIDQVLRVVKARLRRCIVVAINILVFGGIITLIRYINILIT